jgi:sensor histidine kinase YesM
MECSDLFQTEVENKQALFFLEHNQEFENLIKHFKVFQKPIPSGLPILLAWLFIFIFPLFLMIDYNTKPLIENLSTIISIYAPLLFSVFIFSFNQLFLIPRCFIQGRFKLYILSNLLLVLLAILFRDFLLFILNTPLESSFLSSVWIFLSGKGALSYSKGNRIQEVLLFFVLVFLTTSINILFNISIRQNKRVQWLRHREKLILQTELALLKTQLSPHFLFNTLNNITALIDTNAPKAKKAVLQLSKLLRTILYETKQEFIPLSKEIKIIERYTELELLRLPENFDFKFEYSIENTDTKIAPLILIPLVENTFKHCFSKDKKAFIHIRIEEKNGEIIYKAQNSYTPMSKKTPKEGGIGLKTFKKRMDSFYVGDYLYKKKSDESVYQVYLKIKSPKILEEVKENNEAKIDTTLNAAF